MQLYRCHGQTVFDVAAAEAAVAVRVVEQVVAVATTTVAIGIGVGIVGVSLVALVGEEFVAVDRLDVFAQRARVRVAFRAARGLASVRLLQ